MDRTEAPPAPTSAATLVAGVGNIFFGDDGFGSEVARALSSRDLPAGVRVVDYGIRGTHLAYDLLDGWDTLVLIDTVPPKGNPGQVSVIVVDAERLGHDAFDPHGMDPRAVLSTLGSLGGSLPPTFVIGCEPAVLTETIGLSPEVAAAIPEAVEAVERLLGQLAGDHRSERSEPCASESPVG